MLVNSASAKNTSSTAWTHGASCKAGYGNPPNSEWIEWSDWTPTSLFLSVSVVFSKKLNHIEFSWCSMYSRCNSQLSNIKTCDTRKIQTPSNHLYPERDFSCSPSFSSALYWSGAEGCFFFAFQGSLYEAFLAALNGTMVPAYRTDSCFIELVYNVCWMEHINRFKLTSFPPNPLSPPTQIEKGQK